MIRFIIWQSFFLVIGLTSAAVELQAQEKMIKIGYVLDTEPDETNPLFHKIKEEVQNILGGEYQLPIEPSQILYSNWNVDEAARNVDLLLDDESIDQVIGVGVLASHAMTMRKSFSRPALASIIIDATLQNVSVSQDGTSTIDQFTFVLSPYSVERDLDIFHTIFPYQKIAVLIQQNLLEGVQQLDQHFATYFGRQGIDYQLIPVFEKADDALAVLKQDFDAVYVGPIFAMDDPTENAKLIEGINALHLPSFSLAGMEACASGIFASVALPSSMDQIARRVALNILQIVDGEDPSDLSVLMTSREQLHINMATARAINYFPTWDILSQAILLNEDDRNVDRSINFLAAIQQALANNLELEMGKQDVESGKQDVEISNAPFLPQVSISNFARVIDKDRAESGFGSAPEWMSTISGEVQQLILSEPAKAGRDIQMQQQNIRIEAQNALEMDIVAETAEAYLNVLRAKTFLRIQRENVNLSRKNLELAQVRKEVGYAGPSDVYRWESRIALDKTETNQAEARLRQAEMHLNQLLNRPIDELFVTEEVSLADNYLITNDQRLFNYINAPDVFEKFSDFMVEEGLRNLPELRSIDAGLEIRQRSLLMEDRSRFTPAIGLVGGIDRIYLREGAGADTEGLGIPGLTSPNNLNWTLGVSASLPLYTGKKRTASIQKAKIQIHQSLVEKNHFHRLFEQRIRNALQETSASYTNIQLSFDARNAAQQNLTLVQDAYAKGLVPVIQLIDAQNAIIQSELGAANAIYEFVLDLVQLERSIGNFYTLSDLANRDAYFQRLALFVNSK